MAFSFSDSSRYPLGRGFYLGVACHPDGEGYRVGLESERHAITIAGSRSGKGVGQIIPNLIGWPDNALVIDPKGENAAETYNERIEWGQAVYVIDPFQCAEVPPELRAAFNPLDLIDVDSLTVREDIRVIADGLVMRHKAEDSMWDNGAVSVIAGLIAHVLTVAPPERRTLPDVRALLILPDERRDQVFRDMAENPRCGGLALAAAQIGLSKSKKNLEYVSGAVDNTEWLDSVPMRSILDRSTFQLSELKTGKATVYLVLPPEYIGEHGRFLRLFVRVALNVMAKGGQKGARCLFLLDEFYSLGRISEISRAAGLMASYGVRLWPFLQDLGQLIELYGHEGAETFFANADAHIFFGNTDPLTLDYISRRIGNLTIDEAAPRTPSQAVYEPVAFRSWGDGKGVWEANLQRQHMAEEDARRAFLEHQNQARMTAYQRELGAAGRPRIPPDEVREMVAKKPGDTVARTMIVFAPGGDVLRVNVWPYFWKLPEAEPEPEPEPEPEQPPPSETFREKMLAFAIGVGVLLLLAAIGWCVLWVGLLLF